MKKQIVNGALNYDIQCRDTGAFITVAPGTVTLNGPVIVTTAEQASTLGQLLASCGEAAKQLRDGGEQTVLDLFRECYV
jgi:hypothetical protein